MLVSIVAAVAENGVIGADGGLPWSISSDLKAFRRITMGKPIIMGRKTFATLPGPLDGRPNIVITRDSLFEVEGVTAVSSLGDALVVGRVLARTSGADEVMIIGGAEIYGLALPLVDRIYLTRVHASPSGDVLFPALEPAEWEQVSREPLIRGERDQFATTLEVLERRRK
jgi:dihydrofolate reductase